MIEGSHITFPETEGFLIDWRTGDSLHDFKQHILGCAPEFLNNPIDGLSIVEVYVVIWVFGLAASMSFKFIRINYLESISSSV